LQVFLSASSDLEEEMIIERFSQQLRLSSQYNQNTLSNHINDQGFSSFDSIGEKSLHSIKLNRQAQRESQKIKEIGIY
jgi:hypothetical protein